jgi:hypothetical protein
MRIWCCIADIEDCGSAEHIIIRWQPSQGI